MNPGRRLVAIAVFGFLLLVASARMRTAVSDAAELTAPLTLNLLIAAAKKEGRVSWGTYLDEKEVGEINEAFQREFPFIKVDYTRLRPPHERLMLEMQAGNFPYDAMMVRPNLIAQHKQFGHFFPAIDWRGLFGIEPRMIHPESFGVSVVTNPIVAVYNKNLVPKERVPKTWADCYDPYFRGKLVTLVDASHTIALWSAFGDKWALDFAKKLLANSPRWVSGNTNSQTLVATGEMLLVCPAGHGSFYRYVKDQPGVPLAAEFPDGPVVANRDVLVAPIKGAAHPNAALLLTGFVASKGVTLMRTGRESVFHPDSELGSRVRRMMRDIKVESWEMFSDEEKYERQILELWGFPKAKN
jgi:iron(III) transport system substrate-binding protein